MELSVYLYFIFLLFILGLYILAVHEKEKYNKERNGVWPYGPRSISFGHVDQYATWSTISTTINVLQVFSVS